MTYYIVIDEDDTIHCDKNTIKEAKEYVAAHMDVGKFVRIAKVVEETNPDFEHKWIKS